MTDWHMRTDACAWLHKIMRSSMTTQCTQKCMTHTLHSFFLSMIYTHKALSVQQFSKSADLSFESQPPLEFSKTRTGPDSQTWVR